MPLFARNTLILTRDPAHSGTPRTAASYRTKKLSTSACASGNEKGCMQKQHSKSLRHCRARLVDGSTNDAVQQGGRKERLEVEPVLETCAQGWQNGFGGMLGMHGNELVMLRLAIHAYLESWCLCRQLQCNLVTHL